MRLPSVNMAPQEWRWLAVPIHTWILLAGVSVDVPTANLGEPWRVVLGPNASSAEVFAAAELQTMFSELCPAVKTTVPRPLVLHIGYGAAAQALSAANSSLLLSGLGDEGYVMGALPHPAAQPPAAYILAGGEGSARGTLYAVYELLHHLGIRFYAWDETHFPACPTGLGGVGALLPALPLLQHRLPLEYRYMTAAPDSPTLDQHNTWLLRNRFNVVQDEDWHAPINGSWWTPAHGGGWTNAIGFPEATSYTIFGPGARNGSGPPLAYYNEHREWFWPNNDSSVSGQLCWSNASLIAFLTSRVRDIASAQPNTTLLSLSVLDNHNYCQTPAELAVIEQEGGSPAGPLIRALNDIGAAVEQEFPRLTLSTLAYLSFTSAPKTAPRRNVAVRVCSVSCDFGRPLADPTNDCDGFKSDVQSWVALTNNAGPAAGRIWVWNYEADDEDFVMPWPDYRTVGPNIAWYVEHGVRGIYEESSYMAPGGDFAALKSYVIARMMRDPTDDADAIVAEFVFAYYGAEAGPYVLRVIDTLTAAVRTCPGGHANPLCRIVVWTHISRHNHAMDAGDDGEFPKPWLNASVILDCAELFANAVSATPAGGAHRTRVDVAKLPTYFALLYLWEATRAYAEAERRPWPVEPTPAMAYAEFARIFSSIPSPGQSDPTQRPLNENGLTLSVMKQEVLVNMTSV